MAETGGGHKSSAEAVQEGLEHLYGEAVSVTIVDAWKNHVIWPLNRLGDTYSLVVNQAGWLWRGIWVLERKPKLVDALLKMIYPLVAPSLHQLVNRQKPVVVVSVHPLETLYSAMLLNRKKLKIPLVTVVTDMVYGHHTWYQPQTTLCLVPTEEARQNALRFGVPPEKIEVVGQPVALKFSEPIGEKSDLRRKLGLDLKRPTVLIAGGGEGFGPIFQIARAIASKVSQAQLLIVAGRNRLLKKKLEAVDWEIPTAIFGFVDNMPELMSAADVFVTKAGPGSINEAFITRSPLILYHYVPGQEEQNVDYVEKQNAGVYEPEPNKVADLLADWLTSDDPILAEMTANAANLARPKAVLTIARRIYEVAAC